MSRAVRMGGIVAAGAWCALVLSARPAVAQTPSEPRDQVVFSGDVSVHRGEEVGEVVVFHGSVTAAGVVHGDVVVLDGRILVEGQVSGSVVNLNGSITLGPDAQVLGDVIGRDRIRIDPAAEVGGQVRTGVAFMFRSPIDLFGRFAAWLAVSISALILGLLLVWLAPRASDALALAGRTAPWASVGWGVVAFIGLPVAGVALCVTLVGLPLGVAMLLALFFAYSLGFAWVAFALGRLVWAEPRLRISAFLIGWAILAAVSAIPRVGGIVWIAGSLFGLGAATVAMWRARLPAAETLEVTTVGGRHRAGTRQPVEERR